MNLRALQLLMASGQLASGWCMMVPWQQFLLHVGKLGVEAPGAATAVLDAAIVQAVAGAFVTWRRVLLLRIDGSVLFVQACTRSCRLLC
jgi:hypothetical protein